MKKYIIGSLLVLTLVFGGSLSFAPKAQAGNLTSAQVQAVINLLNAFGANPSVISSVSTVLNTSNTGTGTSSTTPTTSAGTYTSSGTSTGNTGNTITSTTTTTTTTNNTTNATSSNGCMPNNTTTYAYNIVNGLPCVKVCTGFPAWNVLANAICIYNTNVTSNNNTQTPSIQVVYPNGGEDFDPGQTVGVKWSSTNILTTNEKVFILLNYYDANGAFVTNEKLAENITNDGGEVVKLPTTLPAGTSWGKNFTVTVGIPSLATDNSDSKFNIE